MEPGPRKMPMAKRESRQRLTTVPRLCGKPATGPSEEEDQSKERMNVPISPPPARIPASKGETCRRSNTSPDRLIVLTSPVSALALFAQRSSDYAFLPPL